VAPANTHRVALADVYCMLWLMCVCCVCVCYTACKWTLLLLKCVCVCVLLPHASQEPRGPRPVCDLLAERLGRAEAEVVQLVEDSGRRTGGRICVGGEGGGRAGYVGGVRGGCCFSMYEEE
jgi:hypothetical protein